MRVAMDPYSSPQARDMAYQLLKFAMPHAVEWKKNEGTNDVQGYNSLTGMPIPGMFRPGPHETSVTKIGTDAAGQEQYGVFDKNTGQLIRRIDPWSAGGGQGATPPSQPPGSTGSSVTRAPNSVPLATSRRPIPLGRRFQPPARRRRLPPEGKPLHSHSQGPWVQARPSPSPLIRFKAKTNFRP